MIKKNYLFWSNTSKIEESHFIFSKQRLDINKLQHFSFCINCAYAVFETQLLTWMPSSKNLFLDSLEFLSSDPVHYSNLGKNKIKKIFCNHSVVHAIAEDGYIYSWGEDTNKTGILGLGKIYNQTRPHLNDNLLNKRITSVSMSGKHVCAVDVNKNVYTWGTGYHGELGQGDTTLSNVPTLVEVVKNKVAKALCGDTYTVFLDYNCNVSYLGEIGSSNKRILRLKNNIVNIEELFASDIICGPGIIAILDTQGYLYFYNDEDGLNKVKVENKISTVRFTNKNIYALSLNKEYLYEFLMKNRSVNTMKNNYYENVYIINQEYSSKLKILELPYYNNVLFFMIECEQASKEKLENKERSIFIPLNIQKTEKSLMNDSSLSYKMRNNPLNNKGNLLPLRTPNETNSNLMNSIDLSHSRIESHKDINININWTENYENTSNISIFPANKNHYSRKDSISIDSQSNNQTTSRENPRHHSLNPFNKKKGHRIQKIYNLLGHIFDKKIEEIRTKFSSTMSPQEKVKKYVDLERVKPEPMSKKKFHRILEEEDSMYSEKDEKLNYSKHSEKPVNEKKNMIKIQNISYQNKENNNKSRNNDLNQSDIISKEDKPKDVKQFFTPFEHKKSNKSNKPDSQNKVPKFNKTTMEEDKNVLVFSKNYNINPIKSAKLEAIRYANTSEDDYGMEDYYKRSNSNSRNNDSCTMNREFDLDGLDKNIFSPPLKRSYDSKMRKKTSTLTVACNQVPVTMKNSNKSNTQYTQGLSPIDMKISAQDKFNYLEIQNEELFIDSPGKKPTNLQTEKLGQVVFIGKTIPSEPPSSDIICFNKLNTVDKEQNFLVTNPNSFAIERNAQNNINISVISGINKSNKESETNIDGNSICNSLLDDKDENKKINSGSIQQPSSDNITSQYKRIKSNRNQTDDLYKLNNELINKMNEDEFVNEKSHINDISRSFNIQKKEIDNIETTQNSFLNENKESFKREDNLVNINNEISNEAKAKLDLNSKTNSETKKEHPTKEEKTSYNKPMIKVSNMSPKQTNSYHSKSNINQITSIQFNKINSFNKGFHKKEISSNQKEEPRIILANNTPSEHDTKIKENKEITYSKKPIKVISVKQRSNSNKRNLSKEPSIDVNNHINVKQATLTDTKNKETYYTNDLCLENRDKINELNEVSSKCGNEEKPSFKESSPYTRKREQLLSEIPNFDEKNIVAKSPIDTPQFKDINNCEFFNEMNNKSLGKNSVIISRNLLKEFNRSPKKEDTTNTLPIHMGTGNTDTFRDCDNTSFSKYIDNKSQPYLAKENSLETLQKNDNNSNITNNFYEKPRLKKGKLTTDNLLKIKVNTNDQTSVVKSNENLSLCNNENKVTQLTTKEENIDFEIENRDSQKHVPSSVKKNTNETSEFLENVTEEQNNKLNNLRQTISLDGLEDLVNVDYDKFSHVKSSLESQEYFLVQREMNSKDNQQLGKDNDDSETNEINIERYVSNEYIDDRSIIVPNKYNIHKNETINVKEEEPTLLRNRNEEAVFDQGDDELIENNENSLIEKHGLNNKEDNELFENNESYALENVVNNGPNEVWIQLSEGKELNNCKFIESFVENSGINRENYSNDQIEKRSNFEKEPNSSSNLVSDKFDQSESNTNLSKPSSKKAKKDVIPNESENSIVDSGDRPEIQTERNNFEANDDLKVIDYEKIFDHEKKEAKPNKNLNSLIPDSNYSQQDSKINLELPDNNNETGNNTDEKKKEDSTSLLTKEVENATENNFVQERSDDKGNTLLNNCEENVNQNEEKLTKEHENNKHLEAEICQTSLNNLYKETVDVCHIDKTESKGRVEETSKFDNDDKSRIVPDDLDSFKDEIRKNLPFDFRENTKGNDELNRENAKKDKSNNENSSKAEKISSRKSISIKDEKNNLGIENVDKIEEININLKEKKELSSNDKQVKDKEYVDSNEFKEVENKILPDSEEIVLKENLNLSRELKFINEGSNRSFDDNSENADCLINSITSDRKTQNNSFNENMPKNTECMKVDLDNEEKYIDLLNKHIEDENDKLENAKTNNFVDISLDNETNKEIKNNNKALIPSNPSVYNTSTAKQCIQENTVNHKHLELNKIKSDLINLGLDDNFIPYDNRRLSGVTLDNKLMPNSDTDRYSRIPNMNSGSMKFNLSGNMMNPSEYSISTFSLKDLNFLKKDEEEQNSLFGKNNLNANNAKKLSFFDSSVQTENNNNNLEEEIDFSLKQTVSIYIKEYNIYSVPENNLKKNHFDKDRKNSSPCEEPNLDRLNKEDDFRENQKKNKDSELVDFDKKDKINSEESIRINIKKEQTQEVKLDNNLKTEKDMSNKEESIPQEVELNGQKENEELNNKTSDNPNLLENNKDDKIQEKEAIIEFIQNDEKVEKVENKMTQILEGGKENPENNNVENTENMNKFDQEDISRITCNKDGNSQDNEKIQFLDNKYQNDTSKNGENNGENLKCFSNFDDDIEQKLKEIHDKPATTERNDISLLLKLDGKRKSNNTVESTNQENNDVYNIIINKSSSNTNDINEQLKQHFKEELKESNQAQSDEINPNNNVTKEENVPKSHFSVLNNDNKKDENENDLVLNTYTSSKSGNKHLERSLFRSASRNSLNYEVMRLNQFAERNKSRKSKSINSISIIKSPDNMFKNKYDHLNKTDTKQKGLFTKSLKKNNFQESSYFKEILSRTSKEEDMNSVTNQQNNMSEIMIENNYQSINNSDIKFLNNFQKKDSNKNLSRKLTSNKINDNNENKQFKTISNNTPQKKTSSNSNPLETKKKNENVKTKLKITNVQESPQTVLKTEEVARNNKNLIEKSSSFKVINNHKSNKDLSKKNHAQIKSNIVKKFSYNEKSLDQSNNTRNNNKKTMPGKADISQKIIKDSNVEGLQTSNVENSLSNTLEKQKSYKIEIKDIKENKTLNYSTHKKTSVNPIKLKKEIKGKEGEWSNKNDTIKKIREKYQKTLSRTVKDSHHDDDVKTDGKIITGICSNILSSKTPRDLKNVSPQLSLFIKNSPNLINNDAVLDKLKINASDCSGLEKIKKDSLFEKEISSIITSENISPQKKISKLSLIDQNIDKNRTNNFINPTIRESIPQSDEENQSVERKVFLRERKGSCPKTKSPQRRKLKSSNPKGKNLYSFSKQFKEDYDNIRDNEIPFGALKCLDKRKTAYLIEKRPKLKLNHVNNYQIKELKDEKDNIEYEFNSLNSARNKKTNIFSHREFSEKNYSQQIKSNHDSTVKSFQYDKALTQGFLLVEENDHIYEYNNDTKNIQGVSLNEKNKMNLSPSKINRIISSNLGKFSYEENDLNPLGLKKTIEKKKNVAVTPSKELVKEDSLRDIQQKSLKNPEESIKNNNFKRSIKRRKKKSVKNRPKMKLSLENKSKAERKSISLNNSFDKEVLKNYEFEDSNQLFLSLIEEEEMLFKKKENIKKRLENDHHISHLGFDLNMIKNKIKDKISRASTYQEFDYDNYTEDKNKENVTNALSFTKKEYFEEPNIYPPPYIEETKKKRNNETVTEFDKYFNYIHNDDILPVESPFCGEKEKYAIPVEIDKYLKFLEKNKQIIDDQVLDAFSDASPIEQANTPTRFRKKIIKNLENFKLGNVEQKLQNLFQKYSKLGNISPFSNNCLTPQHDVIDDNENSRLSELEPIELDKSQLTMKSSQMSSRISAKDNMKIMPKFMKKNINFDKDQVNFTFEESLDNRKGVKTKNSCDPKYVTPIKLTSDKFSEKILKEKTSQKNSKNHVMKYTQNVKKPKGNSSISFKYSLGKTIQNKSSDKLKTYYNTAKRPERSDDIIDKTRNRKDHSFSEKDFFSWNIPTDPPLSYKTDLEKSISEEFKDFSEKDNFNNDSLQKNFLRRKSLKYPTVNKPNFSNTFVDKFSIVNKFLENKSEQKGTMWKPSDFGKTAGSKTVLKTSHEFLGSKEKNRPNYNPNDSTNKQHNINSSINKIQRNVPSNTPISPKNQQRNSSMVSGLKLLNELKSGNENINKLVMSPSQNSNDNVNLITKVRKTLNTHFISMKSQKK